MATEHVSPLNISDLSPPGGLGQADRRATRWWVLELSLGAVASAVAVATYLILSGATPIEPSPRTVALLLIGNVFVAAALVGAIAWRLYNLSRTRGTGAAGAQLHVRMVMVFAAISIVPTVMVALFSAVMLNLGIDSWFSARVKTSIDNAASLAQAYVAEQKLSMQTDVLALAADVNRQLFLAVSDPPAFREYLLRQIGGSVGLAIFASLISRFATQARYGLTAHLYPGRPELLNYLSSAQGVFAQHGLSPGQASQMASGLLYKNLIMQSMVLSFEKLFLLAGLCFLFVLPLVFLLRTPKLTGPAADVHVEV